MGAIERATPVLTDYDFEEYDYRTFWDGREYEGWAESRVLDRVLRRMAPVPWLVDLGGGYGRNTARYREVASRSILVDFSLGNLRRASHLWAEEMLAGRLFLVRAELHRLPFADGAFHSGLLIRVLHHVNDLEAALREMGRTIGRYWIVDVPIKNHLLARVRGGWRSPGLEGPEPLSISSDHRPFWNFDLGSVRRDLLTAGFDSRVVASVNNFRRWERVLPRGVSRVVRPAVCALELGAQRLGRGWWGPSQFLWASRPLALPPPPASPAGRRRNHPAWSALTTRVVCPDCHGQLTWAASSATCPVCHRRYRHLDGIWDFLTPIEVPARPARRSGNSKFEPPESRPIAEAG